MKNSFLIVAGLLLFSPCYGQLKKVKRKIAGGLIRTEYFVDKEKKKEGAYVEYFDKVKITEGWYSNDERVGEWRFYDYEGLITFGGAYVEGKQDGVWIYKNEGRTMSKIYYDCGEVDSVMGYYDDGVLAYELRYEGNAVENTGLAKSYWPNGKLKERLPIRNNKLEGVYELYFENGQLHRTTEYKAGGRYSVLETFYPDGRPCEGGSLQDGNGFCLIYYLPEENTSTLLKHYMYNYKDGVKVEERCFSKDGTLERGKSFKDGMQIVRTPILDPDGKPFFSRIDTIPDHNFALCQEEGGRMPLLIVGDTYDDWIQGLAPRIQYGERGAILYENKGMKDLKKLWRSHQVNREALVIFVTSSIGEIEKVEFSKGKSLYKEAIINTVKEELRTTPGFYYGIPVRFRTILPFMFDQLSAADKYAMIWLLLQNGI